MRFEYIYSREMNKLNYATFAKFLDRNYDDGQFDFSMSQNDFSMIDVIA